MLRCPPAGRMLTRAAGRAEVAWCARMRLGGACVRCLSSIEWTDLDRDPRRRDRRLASEARQMEEDMAMSLTLSHRSARLRPQAIPSAACVYAKDSFIYLSLLRTADGRRCTSRWLASPALRKPANFRCPCPNRDAN